MLWSKADRVVACLVPCAHCGRTSAAAGHNTATQLAMDVFKHLFSNDVTALSLIRNLGLGTAARLGPCAARSKKSRWEKGSTCRRSAGGRDPG